MTTVAETSGLKARLALQLTQQRLRVAARAAAIVLREIMDRTPVEDGHAHAAWLQAATDVASNLGAPHNRTIGSAVSPSRTLSSRDPKAEAAGFGAVGQANKETHVTIRNGLDFVRTLEYGGVIKPIAPGGKKVKKNIRPGERGELYGDRIPSGRGMVFYRTLTGGWRIAPSYVQPPGHFAGRGVDAAAEDARREGLKVRRRRGR